RWRLVGDVCRIRSNRTALNPLIPPPRVAVFQHSSFSVSPSTSHPWFPAGNPTIFHFRITSIGDINGNTFAFARGRHCSYARSKLTGRLRRTRSHHGVRGQSGASPC